MKILPTEALLPRPQTIAPTERAAAPSSAASSPPSEPFSRVLARVGHEVDRGERLVGAAIHGGKRDPTELLALQAGIYRYTEVVDLATKVIDRATSAVKTTLQSQ
jgi:hypothetical protein